MDAACSERKPAHRTSAASGHRAVELALQPCARHPAQVFPPSARRRLLARLFERLREEEITDNAVGQEFEKTPLEPLGDRNVVVSISAPPISTPRSLRRWLPRADQTFLQAS